MNRVATGLLLLGLLLGACDTPTTPATDVVVAVDSNLGADLTSVDVAIYDSTEQHAGGTHHFVLGHGLVLPFSFGVEPKADLGFTFIAVATGKDQDGNVLAEAKAKATFAEGQTLGPLTLFLSRACGDVVPCGRGKSCSVADDASTAVCGEIPMPKLGVLQPGPLHGSAGQDAGTGGSDAAAGGAGGTGGGRDGGSRDGGDQSGTGGSDGGGQSATGDDAGSTDESGVETQGSPCADEGALACGGHDNVHQLACLSGKWAANGTCNGDTRCDTQAGTTQGTCQSIASLCAGQKPGDAVCDGNDRQRCDDDLLRLQSDDCPANAHCAEGKSAVTCKCDDGYQDDGAGGCANIDDCKSDPCGPHAKACKDAVNGYACTCRSGYASTGTSQCSDVDECLKVNGGCDPMVICTNTEGSRTCGACPPYYRGDGETGCIQLWTQQLGSSGDDTAHGVATDASGSVYVAGYTTGGLDGNTNAGSHDLFVVKYDNASQKQWTRQLGTATSDQVHGIATDGSGNVYVAGYTNGSLDGNANAGSYDLFVVKYNGAGQKQWTRQLGTITEDQGLGVATDTSGNVYVAGYTRGGLDGNANAGDYDLFVVKYNGAGQKQWTRQLGTATDDFALGVATDTNGNIYVAGHTTGGLDGNTNAGGADLFVVKYDNAGQKQWTRQLGTATDDFAFGVAADTSGSVYVTGYTEGDLDGNTNAGTADLFVVKYDSAGQKQWTRQLGTTGNDVALGVATDASGNIYATGSTAGSLDGNISAGSDDVFVVKYDSAGQKQWTRQLGTATTDQAWGVATDASGNVYVSGWTDGGLDGNTNAGSNDLFTAKYDSDGNQL